MKNILTTLIAVLATALLIYSCQKEPNITADSLTAKYSNLTLADEFDLPNPSVSEKLAVQLFDLKEDDNGLTENELLSVGNPTQNEDLLYALLFVEAYDRSEILWSWDEPAEEPDDEIDDRNHTAKWRWTGGDPIASMWCSGHQKWPAQRVKNRFTDPCGETIESGKVFKCCYSLCNGDLPTDCQSGCTTPVITIPAGSEDALAQAIADVCPNGTIVFAAGEHIENSGVAIDKRVTIKGENGAVLKIHSDPTIDFTVPISVALHFMGTERARLENLHIEALNAPAGVGILLQDADKSSIKDCHFSNFQYTIIIEESDKTAIVGNTIVCSDAWLAGVIPDAVGITVVNGEKVHIKSNEVSFGLFGIWPCDKDGIYEDNYTHHNYIGMILCRVPPASFVLSNGDAVGAEFSATRWKVRNNVSTDNFDAGYMVIDGANNNSLVNNNAGNNATYDFDLVGESLRFGFLTPTSFNNTVNMGSYSGLTVKDCGEANQVIGNAVIADTSDPAHACF